MEKCKVFGSFIDTETDFKNRKSLLINAAKQLEDIFRNNKISIKVKSNAFETYLSSIFLYNSELWTINQKIITKIDSFQRRMLRSYVLNIKYPKIVRNEEV